MLLASLTWVLITSLLPQEAVVAWAWRIPFLCSVVVAIIALYLRRKMAESPVFTAVQESAERVRHDLESAGDDVTRGTGMRAFIALLGLRVAENAPSYLSSTFIVGYVTSVLMMNRSIPADAVLVGSILGMGVAPLVGYCTDKFGRRPVYRTLCAMLIVFPFIGYALLDSKNARVAVARRPAGKLARDPGGAPVVLVTGIDNRRLVTLWADTLVSAAGPARETGPSLQV